MMTALPPALRLSTAERRLTHVLCYFAASTMEDDHHDLLVREMRDLLRGLSPRPETEQLIEAAAQIVGAYPRRRSPGGGPDWCWANFAAKKQALAYYWAVLCALGGGGE